MTNGPDNTDIDSSAGPSSDENSTHASDTVETMLREAGIVGEDVLNWACHESNHGSKSICQLLAERVPVVERDIWRILARYMGLPFEDLTGQARSAELAATVPSSLAFRHHIAPLAIEDGVLTIAIAQPEVLNVLDEMTATLGIEISAVLSPPSNLERFIQALYGLGAETVNELTVPAAESPEDIIQIIGADEHDLIESLDNDQQASITRFVNEILVQAIKDGASDIHIEPYEQLLRVRFRIDGVLQEVPVPPTIKQFESSIISRIKVLGNLDIAEKRLCQDGQMRLKVLSRPVDVRVSVLPTIYGEGLVLRILDRQVLFRNLDKIGIDSNMLGVYRQLLEMSQGLILVTGPTGSGKTTTQYASLAYVNRPMRKIITIEDPVEYRLDGITQIQVKESIGLSFSNLLRNIVRHDPDVIMIGEIRDSDTADMALSAAMTGHLVFASLHTNDAPTTVARLRNMGSPPYLIAAGLEVVLAQRLVRTICPNCSREDITPPDNILAEFPVLKGKQLYRGEGCEDCRFTGYQGRTALFEFFMVNEELREMILSNQSASVMREAAMRHGMTPLRDTGVDLVARGKTTLDEILRVTRDVRRTLTKMGTADDGGA